MGLTDEQTAAAKAALAEAPPETNLGEIPEYPVTALPNVARDLVEHGSGLPPALLAGAALGALAAAVGPVAQIEVIPTWHERAILWLPLIAPRGAGKSPAQDLGFEPLRQHDAGVDEDNDTDVILRGDQTLEALARNLAATEGGVGLDLDELTLLLRGLGEYKRGGGGDRGRFLALWKGSPWNFTRVGSGGKKENQVKLRITRPTLVVCGGLQPHLHGLLGGDDDGLRPRWLPHLAAMPQDSDLKETTVPVAWADRLRALVAKRGRTRTWTLDTDAKDVFQTHRQVWKRQARGAENASTGAALVKADVHLARVALVLAEAEAPANGGTVGPELIHRAAQTIEFTLNCWRALPEQGSLSLSTRTWRLDQAITRLIAWLESHDGQGSRRELQRSCVAGIRTGEDLDALLRRYEAVYPGTIQEVAQKDGRGMPTTVVKAPPRRPIPKVSADADTLASGGGIAHGNADSGGVTGADTKAADTRSADTNGEALWPPSTQEESSNASRSDP
jgi:hypothetical protein